MTKTAMYPKFRGGGIIEFEEMSIPEPAQGQLLIQCKANALCASDLEFYHGGTEISLGHEAAGIVAACGPGTSTKEGTPGVIFLMDFCGECRSCIQGFTNQCLKKRADYGFTHDGGYGPYILVNENVFFAVDNDVDPAEATMLLDIMGTGSHALKRAALVHPDLTSLLVLGSGPIGLGLIAMAKIRLGMNFLVLVTDMIAYRLELAASLGALPINLDNESLESGMIRHGHQRADVAIDSTGKTSARRDALDRLAQRGVLICVGHGEGVNIFSLKN